MDELKALVDEYIHFIENAVPLWEEWVEELPKQGDFGKLPNKVISEYSGVPENSNIALMFCAFCAGLERGSQNNDAETEETTLGYVLTVTANNPKYTADIFVPDSEHIRVKAYMERYGLSIVHAERTDISEVEADCPVVDNSTFGYYVDDPVSGVGDRRFMPEESSSEDFDSISNLVIDNLIIKLMTK